MVRRCALLFFGVNVRHINEWAGLNINIWKSSYINNSLSVCFIFGILILLAGVHMVTVQKTLNLINMHSGAGLIVVFAK